MTGRRFYAVVHPIDAKIFTSKSRTVRVIASTWLVPIVLALPYLYCKSYPFSIDSHLGFVTRFICTDRFDEIDAMMYGHWHQSTDDYDDGLHYAAFFFRGSVNPFNASWSKLLLFERFSAILV